MRHYQPIWEKLKAEKYCRITAPKPLHKRIIKAVIKEKYGDEGFKFLLLEAGQTARLTFKKTSSVVEFSLTIYTQGHPEI